MIEKLNYSNDWSKQRFERIDDKINEIIDWINSHESVDKTQSNDRQEKDNSDFKSDEKSQPAVCDKHDIIRRLSEDGFFMDCGDFVKKEVKHE